MHMVGTHFIFLILILSIAKNTKEFSDSSSYIAPSSGVEIKLHLKLSGVSRKPDRSIEVDHRTVAEGVLVTREQMDTRTVGNNSVQRILPYGGKYDPSQQSQGSSTQLLR